jgi:NTE family protein
VQRSRSLISLAVILLTFSTLCVGQDATSSAPARRRIGLALSGGGALGLAHIGVIQYFEERHIPIDLVAGTSMGGLIGGFYAVGKNSQDLKGIVDQADWNALLSPNPRFVDQPVVEKQDWHRTSGRITFRFGKRFTLPAGLNPGEMLALLLSRNTLGYSELASFDQLPTPFRCVATDLVSGEPAVLGSGSLQKALRSTMALPGVFTPVKWDNKVLVDGGLVENVPVEVIREMGAETAIAVTLEAPPVKAEQFNSIFNVLRQTVSIAITQNERRSVKLADVVIPVNTANYGGTDYAKSHDLIRAGYDAAKSKAAELAQFEVSPEEWAAYVKARQQKMVGAPARGSVVEVAAANPSFQHNAKEEIDRKLGSGKVSQGEVEDVLSGIVTATGVPGASYQWKGAPAEKPGYRIEFLDRTGRSLLLRPSFTFVASAGEPSRGSLRVSTTTVFAKAYKSRLLATYNIGYDPGVRSEFYRPFDGTGYFIAPGLMIERFHVNRYEGGNRFDALRDRFGATFYGGLGTWRFAQLRFGVQAGYDSYSNSITVDGVPANSHGFANPEVTWLYNTQDSGELPSRGTRIEGSAGYSFRNTSFPYLRGDLSRFQALSRRVSLFGVSSYGSSFGEKLNFYEQFTAGGAGQLTAFRYQEFHTNTMVTGGAGVLVRGPSLRSLSFYPSFVAWYEAGRLDLGSQGWQTHQSTSSGIFFPTPLGAVGFAISFDEKGKARFRVNLGSLGR